MRILLCTELLGENIHEHLVRITKEKLYIYIYKAEHSNQTLRYPTVQFWIIHYSSSAGFDLC